MPQTKSGRLLRRSQSKPAVLATDKQPNTRPWPILLIIIIGALLAAHLLFVRGDLFSIVGMVVFPVTVVLQAGTAGLATFSHAVRRAFTAGSAYSAGRLVLTLVVYYGFDWRAVAFTSRGVDRPDATLWPVVAVVAGLTVFEIFRVAVYVIVGVSAFAVQTRMRAKP